MAFFTVVGVILILYYLSYLILICCFDCDLLLAFYQYFGRSLDKLNKKVVWITGASSGIGEAMAYEVARHGGKLILSARREDALFAVRDRCFEINPSLGRDDILILPLDMTNFARHQESFDKAIQHFDHIDILINNAGRSQRAVWEEIDLEVDKQVFDLNVFGVISLTRIMVNHFNLRGKGRIAVTSSVAGLVGAPFSASYTASKHAIHGYYESLRMEKLGTNISITLLCPGPVFSNFLQESFTSKPNEKYGVDVQKSDRRMSAERCAKLSLIAIVNKLDDAWIARFPVIPILYAIIYFPNFSRFIAKQLGPGAFQKVRDSRKSIET